jgi:hypothetical protein
MRRPKLSDEQRERMLENLDKQITLKARKKNLYNKIFRKSGLFISSWTVRVLYFILFITVACLHNIPSSVSKEVLLQKTIDRSTESSGRNGSSRAISTLYFTTDKDNYIADISGLRIPAFVQGDTMLIGRNIFNKPNLFGKEGWNNSYLLTVNFSNYFIVLFLTLISLFFNDGLDKHTKKILWGFMLIDAIAILFYFLT